MRIMQAIKKVAYAMQHGLDRPSTSLKVDISPFRDRIGQRIAQISESRSVPLLVSSSFLCLACLVSDDPHDLPE